MENSLLVALAPTGHHPTGSSTCLEQEGALLEVQFPEKVDNGGSHVEEASFLRSIAPSNMPGYISTCPLNQVERQPGRGNGTCAEPFQWNQTFSGLHLALQKLPTGTQFPLFLHKSVTISYLETFAV